MISWWVVTCGQHGIDQLVVGEKRNRNLHFIDSVKNGFVPATRQRVFDAIRGEEIERCPFVNLPQKKGTYKMDREKMKKVRWVQPRIIAKLAFNEKTEGGHLRHSKFLRLRESEDLRKRVGNKNLRVFLISAAPGQTVAVSLLIFQTLA
jgi:bifunctional non-homologous end joining protein LigD